MEREFLEDCLARGMSLKGIAKNAGCAPGTVGYWVRKHGLMAHGSAKFDPTRSPDPVAVTALAERGHSLKRIADELGTSPRAVSRCMRKLGITGMRSRRAATVRQARAEGRRSAMLDCPKHGHTEFWIGEKVIRCRRCNATGVANRRRKVKEILVEEAGGSCRLCGYDRSPAALEFHHLDPSTKSFGVSEAGISRSLAASREEAKKCVLVCANCHAEIEVGFTVLPVQFTELDDRAA